VEKVKVYTFGDPVGTMSIDAKGKLVTLLTVDMPMKLGLKLIVDVGQLATAKR